MPYFEEVRVGDYGLSITFTTDRDGKLLLAISELALSIEPIGSVSSKDLLACVAQAVATRQLQCVRDGLPLWVTREREVWELQRWQPFVGWGSKFPGHLFPGEHQWVSHDFSKHMHAGFSTDGWRLDPSAVTVGISRSR